MTEILGKRKRRAELYSATGSQEETEPPQADHLQKLLQQHFEASYEPLSVDPVSRIRHGSASTSRSDLEDEEDWSGVSDEEGAGRVEIVDHAMVTNGTVMLPGDERKLFMSSKPPQSLQKAKSPKSKPQEEVENSKTEASLRKNDLALQRLLQESHLFSSTPSKELEITGKARRKALDLRLQSLGANDSLLEQKYMPMAHRKGIIGKKRSKEATRRSEARENGIILEKERREVKKVSRRERSIGGPSVGKFKGGTLQLSGKDLREIQGPSKERRAVGRGKRRR